MLGERLHWCYEIADQNQQKETNQHKRQYDWKTHGSKLDVGDLCLVRQKAVTGKYKISDSWDNTTYKVIYKEDKLPVYTIKP